MSACVILTDSLNALLMIDLFPPKKLSHKKYLMHYDSRYSNMQLSSALMRMHFRQIGVSTYFCENNKIVSMIEISGHWNVQIMTDSGGNFLHCLHTISNILDN